MPLDVSIRQVLKEVLEVLERVQAVDIGSLDDAVDGGAGLGSFRGVAEQPILAADGEIADGALADVIRERSVAAFQEGLERFFMAQGVLDGFAEFGFRQDVQLDVLKPCEISLELLFSSWRRCSSRSSFVSPASPLSIAKSSLIRSMAFCRCCRGGLLSADLAEWLR